MLLIFFLSLVLSSSSEVDATVVALAGLTGLREGEIRGLQWQDYDGEYLNVCRSVWRTHVHNPKSDASMDKVPVIPSLRKILDEYQQIVPNASTDWIFSGERKHAPLNLANLVRRGDIAQDREGNLARMARLSPGDGYPTPRFWRTTGNDPGDIEAQRS
jgi:integrase